MTGSWLSPGRRRRLSPSEVFTRVTKRAFDQNDGGLNPSDGLLLDTGFRRYDEVVDYDWII